MHQCVLNIYVPNLHILIVEYRCSAPNFHLPKDVSAPMILVGPGTGIAPFRGFWHHRRYQIENQTLKKKTGPIWLFFGCRSKYVDIYKDEKDKALQDGILAKNSLALSRDADASKVTLLLSVKIIDCNAFLNGSNCCDLVVF